MPFPMKIQPIDSHQQQSNPPMFKSWFKQLFYQPFSNFLKISSDNNTPMSPETTVEIENSSASLDKMVKEYIEEEIAYHQKPAQKNGCNGNGSSDDEKDLPSGDSVTKRKSSSSDSIEKLKSLIPCTTSMENNLLEKISKIVEENKSCKIRKEDLMKAVINGLLNLDFNASICKSKWRKSSSINISGWYEYIDVVISSERLLVDVDLRSEFEIARSTSRYKAILQSLPLIFVGKADRLQQIITIVSAAAKRSFRKNDMNFAPWRKTEYMKAKWLGTYVRTTAVNVGALLPGPSHFSDGDSKVGYGSGGESMVGCGGGGYRVGFEVERDAKNVESKDVRGRVGCSGDGGKVGVEVDMDDEKVEIKDVVVEGRCRGLELIFGGKTKLLSEEPESSLSSLTRASNGESSGSCFVMVSIVASV